MAGYEGDDAIIDEVRALMAQPGAVRSEAIRAALTNAGHEPNRSNQRRIEMKMARQEKMQNPDASLVMVFENGTLNPLPKERLPDWYEDLWKDCGFHPKETGFGSAHEIGDDFDMPRLSIWRRWADEVYLVHYDDRFGHLTEILIFNAVDLMRFEATFVAPIAQMCLAEAKLRRIIEKNR